MFRNIKFRKFLPLLLLLVLAFLAGGTSVFGDGSQEHLQLFFEGLLEQLRPVAMNIFFGLIFVSIAYLLYDPAIGVVVRALELTRAPERGKVLVLRTVKLIYWGLTTFIGVSFIAPGFLSQLVVGFGLLGAALTLSLKGIANDFIAGVLLNFSPKCKVGDYIELIGVKVEGKVIDIGYVLTKIEGPAGLQCVPNRDIWDRPLVHRPQQPVDSPPPQAKA